MTRHERIVQQLQNTFTPSQLEVIDDSHKHIGHAGAAGGAGHFRVIISADSLSELSRIEAHRKIYACLNDMMPKEIHALQIEIL